MRKIDMDIHAYPSAIRFKFLDLLGIKQKTLKIPEPGLNIVDHFLNKDQDGLEERTKKLSEIYASEGNVVTAADAQYELTTGKRPYNSLKYHNSSTLIAKCLEAKQTKTKGIYNLRWGILPGKDREFEKGKYVKIGGKVYIEGGHTFSTKQNPVGKNIIVEFETFNLTFDKKDETYEISAWAPRFLETTDLKVDNINSVINKAISNRVFQGKVINPDGEIEYLKDDEYTDKIDEFSEKKDTKIDESKLNKITAKIAKLKTEFEKYSPNEKDKDSRTRILEQISTLEDRLIKSLTDKDLKSLKVGNIRLSLRKIPTYYEIISERLAVGALKKAKLDKYLVEQPSIDLVGLKEYLNREENEKIKLDGIKKISKKFALYIYKDYSESSDIDLDDLSFQSFYEIDGYDPTNLENEVLVDDYRLSLAHWSAFCMTDGEGFKFSKEQIMDVALKVLSEIKERILADEINFTFYLNKMKPLSKSLYLKIRYKLPENLKEVGEKI